VILSATEAELCSPHVVVGRKNFLGSPTINGADTAASSLITVLETAKKNSTYPTSTRLSIHLRWYKREPIYAYQYADKKLRPITKINLLGARELENLSILERTPQAKKALGERSQAQYASSFLNKGGRLCVECGDNRRSATPRQQ